LVYSFLIGQVTPPDTRRVFFIFFLTSEQVMEKTFSQQTVKVVDRTILKNDVKPCAKQKKPDENRVGRVYLD
jgi:hypothetical protein